MLFAALIVPGTERRRDEGTGKIHLTPFPHPPFHRSKIGIER
jgi:hypothetical protein